jgi:uncharacterized protein (TIGR03790 family)
MSIWRPLVVLGALAVWVAVPRVGFAQSAENVAVVINEESDASRRIGEHYARTRQLPPSNVLRIRTTTDEAIERSEYVRTIEEPLGRAIRQGGLQDRILYIVLTKGIPLRVAGTSGASGTVASVDSELTLLYRRLVGLVRPATGQVENPYYLGVRPVAEARPFSHREHDIYLVTRLDAFSVEEALALIDRAQAPVREGRIVLDQRGSGGNGDQWMSQAATRLSELGHGQRVVLENAPKAAVNESAVLGYYSWGAADPDNQLRRIGMNFAPGSIAANLASFDARTFRPPPDAWRPTGAANKAQWFEGSPDALVGDLVREGITGVSGQVDEAFAFGAVRPEILFPAYLAGFNLAEAFYLATPSLSWQTVVIGDPLCAPFTRKPLTRAELEDPDDEQTGLPGLFSKRRLPVVSRLNSEFPVAAVPTILKAETFLDRGNTDAARSLFREAARLVPNASGIHTALALLEEQAGNINAAVDSYRRAAELQPGNAVALNNLAYALAVRLNRPGEALPFAQQAIKLVPRSAALIDTVGWIEHLLGNNAVAATHLDDAVKLDPRNAEIRLHSSIVQAAIGNVERAAAELKESLRLDPSFEKRDDVRQLRERLSGR